MKVTKLISATLVLTALALVTGAQAQPVGRPAGPPPGGPGAGGPGGPGGRAGGEALANYLGLTDAQKAAARALREELHATVEPLAESERAIRESIHQALESGSRDAAAIGNLMLQAHDVRGQIKAAHDTFDAAFEALLTADQKTKFACFKSVREALPGGGPGR